MVTQSAGFKHGSVTRKDEPALAGRTGDDRAGHRQQPVSRRHHAGCQHAHQGTARQLRHRDVLHDGDLPFQDEVRDYLFNDWVKQKGHGFSAPFGGRHLSQLRALLGDDRRHVQRPSLECRRKGDVTVHDTDFPASKPWGDEFEITDEIYQFKNWQPEKVHVLMSLNMAKTKLKKPYQVPIAWVKNYGDGKVMHMSLGHREDVWTNPKYSNRCWGASNGC